MWQISCLFGADAAFAQAVPPDAAEQLPAVLLDADSRSITLNPSLAFFVDAGGLLDQDQIEQRASSGFAPIAGLRPVLLENAALWLQFDALSSDSGPRWKLTLPHPRVQEATLYFRDAQGQWLSQRAGSKFTMSSWPQPGRYPVFALSEERHKPVRYFLKIRHSRVPFSTLPLIVSDSRLSNIRQSEYMLLGVYFGLATLVIALALFNAVVYRDAGFGTYAAHVTAFASAQGVFTGVAGLYWWPESPLINNAATLFLPVLAAASAMWFVHTVAAPKRFSRALDWLMLGLMGLLMTVSIFNLGFPSYESFATINTLISVSMLVLLMVLGVAMLEGDRDARWVTAGFLPVVAATLFPLLRNLGVIASGFWTEHALMLGSAIEVPILFYGLHRRVSQRRNVNARASRLTNVDPLTGLYSAAILLDKLEQSLATFQRYKLPFALLVVDLRNLVSLQRQHGRETADRALVMAAACIRGVAHSTDTVARVGDTQFALLMEGPISTDQANNIATKILASGLRPSSQLPDAEPLQFHIAVGHLSTAVSIAPAESSDFLKQMLKALKDMNDGSRKAIRLVKL